MEKMKKKTTVSLALISICLVGLAGIVAVSASDEPVADVVYEPIAGVTLSKINPDGTTTLVKTGNTSVTVTSDENDTVNITIDGLQVSEDEPVAGVALYKINPDGTTTLVKTGNTSVTVTQNEDGTVNIEVDGSSTTTVDSLKPSERITASARAVYYEASAVNYPMGYQCRIRAYTSNMCVTGEAWAGHLRCYLC